MLSILLTIALMAAEQAATPSGPDLLQRGKDNFRSGHYAEAIDDLRGAAAQFLSPEHKQKYVETGRLETLPQLEETFVYLTVAYGKLGRESEARETIARLTTAERIEPTYGRLVLSSEVAEFPALAARLAPSLQLNPATPSGAPAPSPALVAQTPAPQPSTVTERTAIVSEIDQRLADARAQLEREANERIAAAQKAADERIAAERVAIQREADERVASARAEAEREAQTRIAAVEARMRRDILVSLRKAEILANTGHFDEANDIYLSIVNAPGATREAIAEAAIGLYRTGNYSKAAAAFRRLGALARGEEDLRYYEAVSLYETGQFDEARRQLACALPYLQLTDTIERYQSKIESASSR